MTSRLRAPDAVARPERTTPVKRLAALAVLIPLAACSPAQPTFTPSSSPSAVVAAVSLRESCSDAEAAVKDVDIVLGEPADISAAADRIAGVINAGDQETKAAIGPLEDALRAGLDAQPGMEKVRASQGLIDALDGLAEQCAAAGSSAFR